MSLTSLQNKDLKKQDRLAVDLLTTSSTSRSSNEDLLEESWVENIRSFHIVVKLDGSRSPLTRLPSPINCNAHPFNESLSSNIGRALEPESTALDVDKIAIGKTTNINEEREACLRLDALLSGQEDVNLEERETSTCLNHEEKYNTSYGPTQEEDEMSSAIFSSLCKTQVPTVLNEYTCLMQSACAYGALIRELCDARQWTRERNAEADSLVILRRETYYCAENTRGRTHLTFEYLLRLKDLLEEVIEQKPAIETLIREGLSYLEKYDSDGLLYDDIAEVQGVWQYLKEKLRKLGDKPWTSRILLSEINNFFVTRNLNSTSETSSSQRSLLDHSWLRPVSLPSTPESIPCSDLCQFSWSSSSEDEEYNHLNSTHLISGISDDFYFSQKSLTFESSLSISHQDNKEILGSQVSLEENINSRDLFEEDNEEQKLAQAHLDPDLPNLIYDTKEGRSLPVLFYSLLSSEFWSDKKAPRKPPRQAKNLAFSNEYSCSADSLGISCKDKESLENAESFDTDGNGDLTCIPASIRPVAASEDNLILMKKTVPQSLSNLNMDPPRQMNGGTHSGRCSPNTGGNGRTSPLGVRTASSNGDYSPVLLKRRRLNDDAPTDFPSTTTSGGSSPRDSPSSLHLMLNPGISLGSASFEDTFDELSDSQLSSLDASPSVVKQDAEYLRRKYKKDELWAAIKSDYNYLMDGEIIETCKSTESDLSWESDDLLSQTKVSFTEFMQQYKELTEWLNHIQQMTQRQSSSLSEKYLNMTYHEEMLQRSPRRKVFNDYAKQLMRRYPSMKDEINIRLQHLNGQWETLEKAISPGSLYRDEATMLRDLEQDLNGLRKWLHEVENRLLPLCIRPHWTQTQLEEKLKEHQALQREIESHSKIVSAVLKLCEHLQSDKNTCSNDGEKDSLQLVAINLERRWHAIWLQSLEWQCRLEEAITKGTRLHPTSLTEPDDWRSRFSYSKTQTVNISTHHDYHGKDLYDHSSGDEELSELIYDSDTSNYDTIPFSENEYEKIVVDTDGQGEDHENDQDDGQLSPGGASASSKGSGCSSGMDPAIDSALGRSVSDHSINNEHHHIARQKAQQKITSDQVNRAVNKVVSFAKSTEMRASPEPALAQKTREKTKRMLGKGDHDIGYSSESHSNDEPDFGCQPLAEEQEEEAGGTTLGLESYLLEVPAEGSPNVSAERPRSLDPVVLRKRNEDCPWEGAQGDSGTGPSPVTPDKSWRHSMTSAYDTSSQCSEANSPYDLDATLDASGDISVCTAIERCDSSAGATADDKHNGSVQDLISGGSQNFYIMTSVESDGDSALPPPLNVTTGEDPVREGDADEEVDPAVLKSANFTHSTPIKGRETVYSSSEPDSVESPEKARHHEHYYSSPSGLNVLDVLTELEELSKEQRSDSLCVHVDSESSEREVGFSTEDISSKQLEESISPVKVTKSNESLKKLIQQAELFVRDGDLAPSAARYRRRRKHRSKRHHVSIGGNEPVNHPTDTSAMPTTEDSHISSCDASSEFTDSDGDYITGSSDDESLKRCATKSQGVGPHKFKSNTLPRAKSSKRRDHNCSVTELYELSNRLDLSPFSISEGAIDHLSSNKYALHTGSSNQKLRRTTSEMSSLRRSQEAPTRAKKRKLRRTASDDTEDRTLSAGSINNSQRMSVSVPHSRQQSSQEWQSLSTPDQCPSTDTLQQEWLAACQKEEARHQLTEASEVSDSDVAGKCRNPVESDVDTEDPMLKSMNSTMESFSENAWDNYQDPLYQVNSDDPTEEKLDDSALQWDQNLEFEEDFRLDCAFGSGLKGPAGSDSKVRHRDKRIPTSNSFHEMSHVDDSDSDLEDLHHVIEESRQQITVAESVLNKHHKDVFDTGLYMDASKYTELVATCQTNIKCMEVLSDTIDSGDASINITEDDMQQVKDIVDKWEDLHAKAIERQQQARELTSQYKDLSSVSTGVQDIVDELDLMSSFEDVHDLEYCIKELQTRKLEGHQHKCKLGSLSASAHRFAQQNPDVHMNKFIEETQQLTSTLDVVSERCDQQVSKMQSALFSWYDFNETQKELVYLVGRERRELQCLALTHDILAVSLPDAIDTIHDLKIMKSDFESYENKMWSLRTLSADILPVCTHQSQLEVRQIVSCMESELTDVSRACDDLVAALEEKVIKQGGSVLLHPESLALDARFMDVDLQSLEAKAEEEAASGGRQSLMWRIFKIAVPLHLALIVLLGLAYLLDPDTLASFGVVFSPQLRYVRGPPPV